jgi:hypothetical protein
VGLPNATEPVGDSQTLRNQWDSQTLRNQWDSQTLRNQWDSQTLRNQWDSQGSGAFPMGPMAPGSKQDTSGATFGDAFWVDFPERPGLAMHSRTRRVPQGAPQKLEPQTEASRGLQ